MMRGMEAMRKAIFFFAILLALVNSCAAPTNMNKLYPLPDTWLMVYDDKIYQDGRLFAELRYFGKLNDCWYQGLSIYYYPYDKEVWIYPKEGWHLLDIPENKKYSTIPEIQAQYKRALVTDHYGYAGGLVDTEKICLVRGDGKREPRLFAPPPYVFNAHFSEDGQYVLYKQSGLLFDSSYKYYVEYGISN
jgi:hypothetical protein